MIRLIAIDIDGTLLNSRGEVPAENLAAVAEASRRGIHIAIATGRSFYFSLPAVALLPDPLTLVVHNGAITRTREGGTLMRRLLPRQHAHAVLAATRAWRASTALVFDRPLERQLVYDLMDWTHPNRAPFHERNQPIIARVNSLEEALTEDPVQVTYNGTVREMRELLERLGADGPRRDVTVCVTEYPARDFTLVDVSAPQTTKGAGVAALAAHLGVPREQVLAVGDNYNDREMLEWAGTGVVMGNAAADLRAAGFEVTGTNDQAGLAAAIRRFAL